MEKVVKEGKLGQKFLVEPLRSDQGERVAWRIIKNWIESQLSLLEMQFEVPGLVFGSLVITWTSSTKTSIFLPQSI